MDLIFFWGSRSAKQNIKNIHFGNFFSELIANFGKSFNSTKSQKKLIWLQGTGRSEARAGAPCFFKNYDDFFIDLWQKWCILREYLLLIFQATISHITVYFKFQFDSPNIERDISFWIWKKFVKKSKIFVKKKTFFLEKKIEKKMKNIRKKRLKNLSLSKFFSREICHLVAGLTRELFLWVGFFDAQNNFFSVKKVKKKFFLEKKSKFKFFLLKTATNCAIKKSRNATKKIWEMKNFFDEYFSSENPPKRSSLGDFFRARKKSPFSWTFFIFTFFVTTLGISVLMIQKVEVENADTSRKHVWKTAFFSLFRFLMKKIHNLTQNEAII